MSTCTFPLAAVLCCLPSYPTVSVEAAEPSKAKTTRHFQAAVGCIDTLIAEGTDRYGAEHSPLFSSILDLKTHGLPEKAPPLLRGQRQADRAFPGCNVQHDLFTLLVMYHLSRLTGQHHYAQAADAYLEFFLRRCASAGNGLFPCGEHAFWDFKKEAVGGLPIHEDLGSIPVEFLERLWEINPRAVEKHVRGLQRHFLEGDAWIWNRHAHILKDQRPTTPADFPRHGGFYIYQWAFLYTKVKDPQLLDWAKKTAGRRTGWPHSVASMGISMLRANQILGEDKIQEFETIGRECLKLLVEDPKDDFRNGIANMYVRLEKIRLEHKQVEKDLSRTTYGFWDMLYAGSGGYGFVGSERLAIMCLDIHRIVDSPKHLQVAKDICEFYLTHPRPSKNGITPGKIAGLIAMALDLHDLTGEAKYLEYARENADFAVKELYADGLFRAATGTEYYEAANGVGPLLLELLRLHLIDVGSDYSLPRNYSEM